MERFEDLELDQQLLYLSARLEVISTVLEIICVDRVSSDESEDPVRIARKFKEDLLALIVDRPNNQFNELCKEFLTTFMDDIITRAKSPSDYELL